MARRRRGQRPSGGSSGLSPGPACRAPETNVPVAGHQVDALWRAERLVVEVDGYAFHAGRPAFERDRLRDADLLSAGQRVMRVTWRQLTRDPEELTARLAGLLTQPRVE